MRWEIEYEEDAYEFLEQKNLLDRVEKSIVGFLKGQRVDIKKLKGKWEGYFRLRIGKIRVIFKINKQKKRITIRFADYRGEIYKK